MKFLYFIYFFLLSFKSLYSEIIFEGLIKLSKNDLQSLTDIKLDKNEYSENDINTIINDFYKSNLISKIKYDLIDNNFYFFITETPVMKNIYFNGNTKIKDIILLSNIKSKLNTLYDRDKIISDIDIIKSIYKSKGYNSVSIEVKTENFNNNINLIFSIYEGSISKLANISFKGNITFPDSYLYSLIKSKTNNIYNIFSSGSNLNEETFDFDKNKINKFYKSKGFFDVNVSYALSKNSFNRYDLIFFIKEGNRLKINDTIYEFQNDIDKNIFTKEINDFLKKINRNSNFFDGELLNNHLSNLDDILYSYNLIGRNFNYNFLTEDNFQNLYISESKSTPNSINQILITGNSITKDKTLRSKLSIEPGDYLSPFKIEKSKNDLSNLKYINSVKISQISINDKKSDIKFEVDENTKTGNLLLGGSFSGDTGFGIGLALKDYNILGTGNEVDLSINANSEKSLFSLSYSQYNLLNSNIINTYTIFNQENDLSSSFGFKSRNQGLSYDLSYSVNDTLSLSLGSEYEMIEGYSPSNSNSYITENIDNFEQVVLNFKINKNTTDNFLYPTDGNQNSLSLKLSPENLSDDSYYRINLTNKMYKKFALSDNFLFMSNNLGLAESLNGNLKTINAFSLGGLNFKGFDYRGIGPTDNNIYLGGNKYLTSTFGYGSSFLFDDKDNINLKLFTTFGSIWDSDYTSNNEFKLRSSAGISFDVITAVGPISFSYAVPMLKQNNDKIREFNFSIGTSF